MSFQEPWNSKEADNMAILELFEENAVFLRAIEGVPVLIVMALFLFVLALLRKERGSFW
jgi:hypothetical protein